MNLPPLLPAYLSSVTGSALRPGHFRPVSGGSINAAFRLDAGNGTRYFVKINSASKFPHLFRTEAAGLRLLLAQNILYIPRTLHEGTCGEHQVLLLEWIEPGAPDRRFWEVFGEQLARLHRVTAPTFGLAEDNYMGSVPQENTPAATWVEFFISRRLEPMVTRCSGRGLLPPDEVTAFEKLYTVLPHLFPPEPASLLHGDLWSGNVLCHAQGYPVLIDPAVAFGHRSADLAMTTLFGGFDPAFYEAYRQHAPFPPNYKEQWRVCHLYPLLIHLFLFGRSYLAPIQNILRRY